MRPLASLTPTVVVLATVGVLAGCSGAMPTDSATRTRPELDVRALDAHVLPAGLHFRPIAGHDDLYAAAQACLALPGADCTAPSLALVAGPFTDLDALTRARDDLAALEILAPGYPLVAHADQLGIVSAPATTFVIVGLFASTDALAAWRAQIERARGVTPLDGLETLELPPFDRATTRGGRVLIELDVASARVAAWALADVIAGKGHILEPADITTEPACTLDGRAVVAVDAADIDALALSSWLPVTCADGTAAVVDAALTRLNSVTASCADCAVARTATRARLVTMACGAPSFELRRLAPDGAVVREELVLGCASQNRDLTMYEGAAPVCDPDWQPSSPPGRAPEATSVAPAHLEALYPQVSMRRTVWLPSPAADCELPPPADCTLESDRPECVCATSCYTFRAELGAAGDIADVALEVYAYGDPQAAIASHVARAPLEARFCVMRRDLDPIPVEVVVTARGGGGCVGFTSWMHD